MLWTGTADEEPDEERCQNRQANADGGPGDLFSGAGIGLPEEQRAGGYAGMHAVGEQQAALGAFIDPGDDE